MKELLKQVKQYKKDSLFAPFYSALEVVMEVIIPFVMAMLIDEGVEKGDMKRVQELVMTINERVIRDEI